MLLVRPPEVELRLSERCGVALFGRFEVAREVAGDGVVLCSDLEPVRRLGKVLGDILPRHVGDPEHELRASVARFGLHLEHAHHLCGVPLLHGRTQVNESGAHGLFGGQLEPARRLEIVLQDAFPVPVG